MPFDKSLNHSIELIYEAAGDSALWPQALESITRITSSFATHYLIWDKRQRMPIVSVVDRGYSEHDQHVYAEYYGKIDPRLSLMNGASPGCHLFARSISMKDR